jgi:hypothetical protein
MNPVHECINAVGAVKDGAYGVNADWIARP